MSLRALIEAKQRRTTTLPILVGNPSAAAAEVETFRGVLAIHLSAVAEKTQDGKKPTKADRDKEAALRADLAAAQARQAEAFVEVELQSLPEADWEALFGGLEPDENGDIDISAIHAPLLAASCTDPELQDADWWAQQLSRPEWTDGDKGAISQKLLELNVYVPRGFAGKG